MPTITWSSHTDWQAATSRTGLATKSVGPFSRHDLRLGIDWDQFPFDDAIHYWPLEEDPQAEDNWTTDYIGDADAIYKNDPGVAPSGVHGSSAPEFNGVDEAVGFNHYPKFDHDHGFCIAFVFEHTDDRNLRTLFHNARPIDSQGAVWIAKNEGDRVGCIYQSDGDWVGKDDFHLGNVTQGEPHTAVVSLRGNNSQWTIDWWLDGNRQTKNNPDRRRDALSDDNNYGAIGAVWFAEARWLEGIMDDVIYWNRGLIPSEAQAVHNAWHEGELTTAWKATTGSPDTLDVVASVPANTTLDIRVDQDTSGDGTPNASQTIPLNNTDTSYSLSGFSSTDASYRLHIDMATTDLYATPLLGSATVTTTDAPSTGVWDTVDANGVVETTDGIVDTL